MSATRTFEEVAHLFPEALTPGQKEGITRYLNEGVVPPADPCLSCDPNLIRKYIARVQTEEKAGRIVLDHKV